MMIVPRCSSTCRITPCQIRKPASVTTNEGTPTNATIEPQGDRKDSEVARLEVVDRAPGEAGHARGCLIRRRRRLVLSDDLDPGRAHGVAPAVAGIPETFVGVPAVIAWTTSCWVVFSRS